MVEEKEEVAELFCCGICEDLMLAPTTPGDPNLLRPVKCCVAEKMGQT